jgi:hypothetical protein
MKAEAKADIMDRAILDEEAKGKAFRDVGYNDLSHGYVQFNLTWYEMPYDLAAKVNELPNLVAAIKDEKFSMFYQVAPSEQKQMVLPDAWESSVRPGWTVELLFDKEDLNKFRNRFPPSHRRIRYARLAALNPSSALERLSLGPPSNKGEIRGRSLEPSLRPASEGGKSHRRSLSGLISKLGG